MFVPETEESPVTVEADGDREHFRYGELTVTGIGIVRFGTFHLQVSSRYVVPITFFVLMFNSKPKLRLCVPLCQNTN